MIAELHAWITPSARLYHIRRLRPSFGSAEANTLIAKDVDIYE
jgi:hypothetical protein